MSSRAVVSLAGSRPKKLSLAVVDQLRVRRAEFAIGPRVPEIVGELFRLDVDLQRLRIRR